MKHLIILIAVVLAGCHSPKPTPDISSLNWNLDVDQPIRQLEETLETLEQQQPRNYTIANISFLYEVKLYLVFDAYLDSLPVDKRSQAIQEQEEWMDLHRRKVDEAYAEFDGGTYAGMNAGEVSIDILKERIGVIQNLMTN